MSTISQTFELLLREAGRALFEAYALPVSSAERPDRVDALDIQVAAILGFTGDDVRGSVMLAMSNAALEASKQTPNDRPQDWIAELTNQLAGRIKNRMAAYDVDISISTPLVVRGERIAPCMAGDQAPVVWTFSKGVAYGWVDFDTKPAFEFIEKQGGAVVALEGESLMF